MLFVVGIISGKRMALSARGCWRGGEIASYFPHTAFDSGLLAQIYSVICLFDS